MLNFLHNSIPSAILLDLGFIKIYWYGLIIAVAMVACFILLNRLAVKNGMDKNQILDLVFYLVIFSLIGARLWHVFFYNWPYFSEQPWQIFQPWGGGLAIHGGLLAGLLFLFLWSKKNKIKLWRLTDILSLVIPLGQAIGRWGNYFNQELFGRPCANNWCIFIDPTHRPLEFLNYSHFQPLFLIESLLNLLLFIALWLVFNSKKNKPYLVSLIYMAGYGVIRFGMEFLRLDTGGLILGLKPVQWLCLVIIGVSIGLAFKVLPKKTK